MRETSIKQEQIAENDDIIVCRNCGNLITTLDQIISQNGKHIHVFKNPSGIIFEIGCFLSTSGCIDVGESTMEHTWFSGYAWRISICSICNIHLGWRYSSGIKSFYGLILDRLLY